MAHFTTTLESKASAETVFAYLADFSNTQHWDPSVSEARLLSDPPIAEGSRFEVRLPLLGRELVFEYRITHFDPPRRIVLESELELLRSLDTIEIETMPFGCRLRYDADLRPRGAAYLLDLPLHFAFQISGARSAQGLERALARLVE